MEKMRLPAEELRVESFEPGMAKDARGAVNAMAAGAASGNGCNPDFTTVMTKPCCP